MPTAPVFLQRTGSLNPSMASMSAITAPRARDFDGDGTLTACPSIDKLRLHIFCRSQGDLDLVMGKGDGELNYMENTDALRRRCSLKGQGTAEPLHGRQQSYCDVFMAERPGSASRLVLSIRRRRTRSGMRVRRLELPAATGQAADAGVATSSHCSSWASGDGTLIYYENTGTGEQRTAPVFVAR